MELFLEMVPPESLFLTMIPILIFLDRLSEFSNFLENTAVFLQVESFLFPLSEKGLVPKDAHVLTDALVESLENVILGRGVVVLRKVSFFVEETLTNSYVHGG